MCEVASTPFRICRILVLGTPVSSLAAQEEERLAMGQRQKAQDIPSSHRQQARATALARSLPWAGPPAP